MTVTPTPRVAVIVVAAGSGTRLGQDAPKAFVGLGAHTILRHSLRAVFAAPEAQVVVVAPAGREGEALTDAREAAGSRVDLVSVVTGGETRQASVAAGLARLWPSVEVVLVHDAARALTPAVVFERVIEAVDRTGWGVIPGLPVIDTIKRVDGQEIVEAVDRSQLAAAQTPQGFRRDVLETSYAVAREEFTDDAALVAAAGHRVALVEGDALSFKITTPADLDRARSLAAPVAPVSGGALPDRGLMPRVGVGTDVHAFGEGGVLWLAGIEWPGEAALSGHSDGDAVSHAIVDALLSAAGLGDIGTHFGTARPEYAGAHAEVFLAHTRALLGEAGFDIVNVAVQVQSNRPKFAPRRAEAEAVLSAALGGAPVSVAATTTDGLGFTGAGEGVQAFAVAFIRPV
ncbi:2-C-methyl-D-erythritol 4-phosphate cytidylyltransferase [Microbacterium stercoris]|uniref:Bifunctional enzyme IspD/IspF n=1 Tax=Microbacterium stercoris TaxID=2820289 RepID=A0A939QJG6_9MICO|nr:2-C-methyl-D-erythritol 4-phosphate cytidylyltransferase [Microbacterium stercoris]MBO3663804.1 2-C-methyl-D-erythritol 2,4-cyclodiphosphate synthase [Microbacterium stercoris]